MELDSVSEKHHNELVQQIIQLLKFMQTLNSSNEWKEPMIDKKITKSKSPTMEVDATLQEIPSSELLTIMEKIYNLYTNLHRIATMQNSESSDVISQTQSALVKISIEIVQVVAFRYIQRDKKAIQRWENEGGNVE